jgi:hypothetical protein
MRKFATWVFVFLLLGIGLLAALSEWNSPGRGALGSPRVKTHFDVQLSTGTAHIDVYSSGQITEVSDDDREILRMTPGAHLTISSDDFPGGARLEVRSGNGVAIDREFFVKGRPTSYDPTGKAWVGELLPDLLRNTGFGADARVERILKQAGVDGVFAEISRIPPGSVKQQYITALFQKARTDGETFARALTRVGKEVSSDHELRELLGGIVGNAMSDKTARITYLEAARSIDSDYELATLLTLIAETQPIDATVTGPYFEALGTVDSDFESGRVLSALIGRTSDPVVLVSMLQSVSAIDSDHEAAEFLTSFAATYKPQGFLREIYIGATRGISSEYEVNRALAALK